MRRYPKLFGKNESPREITITSRRERILRILNELRLADSEMIRALLMDVLQTPIRGRSTGEVVKRDLRELFRGGYVAKPRGQLGYRYEKGNTPHVYTLDRRGADHLRGAGIEAKAYSKPNKLRWTTILHRLMISRFRVTLQLALGGSELKISSWIDGTKLSGQYKPDARFLLVGEEKIQYLLECDRSQVDNNEMMERYIFYWHKAAEHHILTITETQERAFQLSKSLGDKFSRLGVPAQAQSRFLFTWEANYSINEPGLLLTGIWRTPRMNLIPLISSHLANSPSS